MQRNNIQQDDTINTENRVEDTRPTKLLRKVKQNLPRIVEFCKQRPSLSEILHHKQEKQYTDKGVDHLKQVEGNKTPCDEQKLLKGLSQISFAHQFTACDWSFILGSGERRLQNSCIGPLIRERQN